MRQVKGYFYTDCRYGDESRWCSTIAPQQCYDIKQRCCETCKRYDSKQPGCNYGDKIPGCTVEDCVHGSPERVKITCCYTCSLVKGVLDTSTVFPTNEPSPIFPTQFPGYQDETYALTTKISYPTTIRRRKPRKTTTATTRKPRKTTAATTTTVAPITIQTRPTLGTVGTTSQIIGE